MKLDADGNPIVEQPTNGPEGAKPTQGTKPEVKAVPEVQPFKLDATLSAAEQTSAVLSEAGLDAAAVTAAGKLSLADTIALREKFGDAVVASIQSELATAQDTAAKVQQETDERLYGMCADAFAGISDQTGEEVFNDISAWAKDNLEVAELDEANKLLAMGGMAAQLVMQDLLSVYQGTDQAQPKLDLESVTPATNKADGSAMSRSEYSAALDKALAEGHSYESPTVKKLQARRNAGAAQGI